MSDRSFHEFPLVLFTALAVEGAGVALVRPAEGSLVAAFSPNASRMVAAALIGSGLAISLLHLGRKSRAWRALAHFGRSVLSTEVAIALVVVAAALSGLSWITAAGGLALLISIGLVYRIPGQSAWGWEGSISPLVLGTAFGFALQFEDAARPVLVLLCVDLLLAVLRWRRLERERGRSAPAHPRFFAARRGIAAARVLGVTVLSTFALAFSCNAAAAVLAAGIVFDRFAFYALALQRTTEAEVERVEAIWRAVGT